MNNFREALKSNSLFSLPTSGTKFTWYNKRKAPDQILECLDRFVANQAWINAYPNFKTFNPDFSYSDHKPVIINTNVVNRTLRTIRTHYFSFNHNWLLEENCKSSIRDIWVKNSTNGNLPQKLHYISKNLQGWANTSVGFINKQLNKIYKKIESYRELETHLEMGRDIGFLESQLEKLLVKEER